MEINGYIDYTSLKADATDADIIALCKTAVKNGYFGVCVNPCYVKLAKETLKGSGVKAAAVIGFPLGANTTEIKAAEAAEAVKNGADELDLVANVGAIKQGKFDYVLNEINAVRSAGVLTKVIIETCLLNDVEKVLAAETVAESNAEYVKTSTGFSAGGADVNDVKILKAVMKRAGKKVKAAGGVRSRESALEMITAGADRIGVSKEL